MNPFDLTDEEFLLIYGMTREQYNNLTILDEIWNTPDLNGYTGSGEFFVDWYCPYCGAGNTGSSCWSCGYHYGSEVIDATWNEHDVWDNSFDGGWGSFDDDWGYSGGGYFNDDGWGYAGSGYYDDDILEDLIYYGYGY